MEKPRVGTQVALFFRHHPVVRQALLWAIPAIVFGAVLRAMLLSYSPYAYFGSDSRSNFSFAHGVLTQFYISLDEKRRYLYPLVLLPITALPGSPLKWLAWWQALLGLATVVPFAYTVRKMFVCWRWVIVPLTVIYAGLPMTIWFEHELIGDSLFFVGIVWACAGWVAWVSQENAERARALWWWFFAGIFVVVLTKASGRFLWPGLFVGMAMARSWRVLGRREWIATALLFLVSLTAGRSSQGAWLLYTTVFPMTQLETPLHAEYKAEIRDLVLRAREHLDTYNEEDGEPLLFLRSPQKNAGRPHWSKLAADQKALARVYRDLAFEAIKAEPRLCAYVSLQRLLGTLNPAEFGTDRFKVDYFARRIEPQMREGRTSPSMLRLALGIPKKAPMPAYEEVRRWLCPHPDSRAAVWLTAYIAFFETHTHLIDKEPGNMGPTTAHPPTALGWWLLAASVLTCAAAWRRTLGVWVLAMAIYLFAVFLVGIQQTRYIAAAWPVVILLLPVPIDLAVRLCRSSRFKVPSSKLMQPHVS